MTEPSTFDWDMPPRQRVLMHLGYAADQVRDLLPFVAGEQEVEPDAVAAACVDSFVLNVRLIADFLTGGNTKFDVLAGDLVPGWGMDADLHARLREWHSLASKHAMHMSQKRVSAEGVGDPVTPTEFRRMAADVAEAVDAFRTALGMPRFGPM